MKKFAEFLNKHKRYVQIVCILSFILVASAIYHVHTFQIQKPSDCIQMKAIPDLWEKFDPQVEWLEPVLNNKLLKFRGEEPLQRDTMYIQDFLHLGEHIFPKDIAAVRTCKQESNCLVLLSRKGFFKVEELPYDVVEIHFRHTSFGEFLRVADILPLIRISQSAAVMIDMIDETCYSYLYEFVLSPPCESVDTKITGTIPEKCYHFLKCLNKEKLEDKVVFFKENRKCINQSGFLF